MTLLERTATVLRTLQWRVETSESEPGWLHLRPSDGPAGWPLAVVVNPEHLRVVLYSYLPADVPEDRRTEVALALSAINLRCEVASLEIDLSDGEVRVRTVLDLGACEVDDEQLTALVVPLVAANLETMGTWREVVEAVADGTDLAELDVLGTGA